MGSDNNHEVPNHLPHVFMISFPAQGHINPLLRLGKRIASKGLLVTFSTTESFGHGIQASNDAVSCQPVPIGDGFIRFEFFDDEWPEVDQRRLDMDQYLPQLESVGRRRVPQILTRLAEEARPVSCLVNNPFIPWVSDVAEELGLPSAMLWVQSCACFMAYYCYFHSLVPFPSENAPHIDVEIPSLLLLKWDEIPSFLHPTTPFPFLRRAILGQYANLSKPFCILADTFNELEEQTVGYTNTLFAVRPVGPLFRDPNARPSSIQVRADPMRADQDCLRWLDERADGSVVYISLGTVVPLFMKQEQTNELAAGIAASGVSFLWVMKPQPPEASFATHCLPGDFWEKVGHNGKVVQYAPQEQVLAHPAIACFMTHCGWNSSMEALTLGVPVVAFPQWGDQVTDAKFLCDVFGVGVQLCRGEHEKIISRDQVEKCLREATSGLKVAGLKHNALKWKAAAERAIDDGGSSDMNIQYFVNEVKQRSKIVHANYAKSKGKIIGEAITNGH